MRFYIKTSALICALLLVTHAFAATNSIVIKGAELQPAENAYRLNAYLEISLDEDLEEAINKGVPINFLYEFQLVEPHRYWFDDEIITASTNFTVSYHALTRQYLVNHAGRQTSHEILSEALLELMQIDDWKVIDKSALEKGVKYRAALQVRLDQSKLPKALQVEAIGSKDWNLSSAIYEWFPKELNK